jgi:hypothetical protein
MSTLNAFMRGETVDFSNVDFAEQKTGEALEEEEREAESKSFLFNDLKKKLIAGGIPEKEIAIVADFNTDVRREDLWERVNAGEVRVLLGSSSKMGVGVNVQQRLVALHHLDAPWLPADIEQREGRIIRFGNTNKEVSIYRYAMEKTLDAAIFAKTARKAKFIWQVMAGKLEGREFEDPASELTMSVEEQLAAINGDPLFFEKIDLDRQRRELEFQRESHFDSIARSRDYIKGKKESISSYKGKVERSEERIAKFEAMQKLPQEAVIDGKKYTDHKEIGAAVKNFVDAHVKDIVAQIKGGKLKAFMPRYHEHRLMDYSDYASDNFQLFGYNVYVFAGTEQTMDKDGQPEWSEPSIRVAITLPKDLINLYGGEATTGAGLINAIGNFGSRSKGMIEDDKAAIKRNEEEIVELQAIVDSPWDGQAELDRISDRLSQIESELYASGEAEAKRLGRQDPPPDTDALQGDGLAGAAAGPGMTPLLNVPSALPPKSQREIIADLSKILKTPIRFGRLRSTKFAGYFAKVSNLIASRKANDTLTISHEVGHKLDEMLSLSQTPAIDAELQTLGDPATPNSRSTWTASQNLDYKRGEGVAEFVRYWLTEPSTAQRLAPSTFVVFEQHLDANKDLGDKLRQSQHDIYVWRTAEPQARLRSHISIGGNPNKTRYTLDQATRDLVDDLHILKLVSADAEKNLGRPLAPTKDPYVLSRLMRGAYGMASTFIRSGTVDFKTKEVTLGKSLEDALKPVGGRLNDFRDWIVSKRARELNDQGRETGLLDADIDYVVNKFDADPDFNTAFDAIKDWSKSILHYVRDAGGMSDESLRAIEQMNQDYVPFHRLFEVGAGENPSEAGEGGRGLNLGTPSSMKRLQGSTRDIVDPIETLIKNAYTLVTFAEKSAIHNSLADLADMPNMGKWVEKVSGPKQMVRVGADKIRDQLETLGADMSAVPMGEVVSFFTDTHRAPVGENTIRTVHKGQETYLRLNRDLFDTFHALDMEDAGTIMRILSAPAQLLRAGVTLEPVFSTLWNPFRDAFSSAVYGQRGLKPFEALITGLIAHATDKKMIAEWKAAGGAFAVETHYYDRNKLQKYITERITKDMNAWEKSWLALKSPFTILRLIPGTMEEATRIGEYKKAFNQLVRSGMPEGDARKLAAFEARDRQDFAKGGAKTKALRMMAAFWNAGLQETAKFTESHKNRPVRTVLQGLAFITIPKLLEQFINWDDDDYWELPQWRRDLFFNIPFGKDESGHTRFVPLPIPFLAGITYGTSVGRMLQAYRENNPEAIKTYPRELVRAVVPNPTPQFALSLFETFAGPQGWSFFKDQPIVPNKLADLPTEMQYTEQSSELAKQMGKHVGISPMKVDHLIGSMTGGTGRILTGQKSPLGRLSTPPLNVSNQSTEDFYKIRATLRSEFEGAKEAGPGHAHPFLSAFDSDAKEMAELRRKDTEAAKEQIFQMAKKRVKQFKALPEDVWSGNLSEEAQEVLKDFSRDKAKSVILSDGLPERKKGEDPDEYQLRVKDWEVGHKADEAWLKEHKSHPAVKEAIAFIRSTKPFHDLLKGREYDPKKPDPYRRYMRKLRQAEKWVKD